MSNDGRFKTVPELLVRWPIDVNQSRLKDTKWSKVHVRATDGAFSTACGRWIPQGRREENGSEVSGGVRCTRCFNALVSRSSKS